jgi:hypothetical protein
VIAAVVMGKLRDEDHWTMDVTNKTQLATWPRQPQEASTGGRPWTRSALPATAIPGGSARSQCY